MSVLPFSFDVLQYIVAKFRTNSILSAYINITHTHIHTHTHTYTHTHIHTHTHTHTQHLTISRFSVHVAMYHEGQCSFSGTETLESLFL